MPVLRSFRRLCVFCRLPASTSRAELPFSRVWSDRRRLDLDREWWITGLAIEGNRHVSTSALQNVMVTQLRPWYMPWRSLAQFDAITLATDVERLARFYKAQGFYRAKMAYDLHAVSDSQTVKAHITIREGEPITVSQVTLAFVDYTPTPTEREEIQRSLPLVSGTVFTEERYVAAETKIKEFFQTQGRGRVKVERAATVMVEQAQVAVTYTVTVGLPTVFGDTTIDGTSAVDPTVVQRELAYRRGEPFSIRAVEATRKRLVNLGLFRTVRVWQDESEAASAVIPIHVHVEEKAFREWDLSVGYGSEDQLRGQVRWRRNNWFGGGRRLDVLVKASMLTRHLEASFVQPHVLGRRNRFVFTVRPQQLSEPGYLLHLTRFQPRLEREFSPILIGFVGYRLEYDQLNNVAPATIQRLREFQRTGVLSGLSLGLLWNTTDDPVDPTRGHVSSIAAERVGGVLGGNFSFVRVLADIRHY